VSLAVGLRGWPQPVDELNLADALERIAAAASDRDRVPVPAFPEDAFAALEAAGALRVNCSEGARRPPARAELDLVRSVARADGSVGRIFDGHLNGVERLAVQAPAELRDPELAAVRDGAIRVGVWGGDPRPGEGPPASVVSVGGAEALRGVKTFCSGAGGLHRALVLARNCQGGPPVSVWIDLTDAARVEVDATWYRGSGLRASVSHRVVFHDAPVLARFGEAGSLSAQPWFARDGLRTAASWAGMSDAALEAALDELAERPSRGALEGLAVGRMLTASGTISAWLQVAAEAMDAASPELSAIAVHGRAAIAEACRSIVDEAARACGSHAFAVGGRLDRARRDLDLFLLQHRLDPALATAGSAALEEFNRCRR
jgi:alkylation response protein AidB-like acyl-CoA dehydrogenase